MNIKYNVHVGLVAQLRADHPPTVSAVRGFSYNDGLRTLVKAESAVSVLRKYNKLVWEYTIVHGKVSNSLSLD